MLLLSLLPGSAAPDATGDPAGPEFQVSTLGAASRPSVSGFADGGFLVSWASYGSGGDDDDANSIQGRRYGTDGEPLGPQFQVNTYTTSSQYAAAVAVAPDSGFVVTWHSLGSFGNDASSASIQAQRYAADGMALGAQFQVNTYVSDLQWYPSVASVGSGFVVVWSSFGSGGTDNDGSSIQGRRFGANGTPQGPDFQINTYTPGPQFWPSIASSDSGDFIVAWTSQTDGSSRSVQARLYAADGKPFGPEFQVNTYTTNRQAYPSVSTAAGGGFVVTWASEGSAGSDDSLRSIQGRRFSANGTPAGDDFQINTYTTDSQNYPSVSVASDGAFVVSWRSLGSSGSDTSGTSIQGRRYEADGTPAGDDFQVNTYTTNSQYYSSVTVGDGGNFVVIWDSIGSDSSNLLSILGQRYGNRIFADGFESGDTSAWSPVIP